MIPNYCNLIGPCLTLKSLYMYVVGQFLLKRFVKCILYSTSSALWLCYAGNHNANVEYIITVAAVCFLQASKLYAAIYRFQMQN